MRKRSPGKLCSPCFWLMPVPLDNVGVGGFLSPSVTGKKMPHLPSTLSYVFGGMEKWKQMVVP